ATLDVVPALVVSTAFDAGRVLVRVEADALDVAPPPAGAGLIEQIRAGDPMNTIAIALNPRAGMPRVMTTTANESTPVSIEAPLSASKETSVQPSQQPPAVPAPSQPEGLPPQLAERPAKLQTMVIDAGHGGDDAGVHGPKGTLEKQITLDVARRLKTL